ncbi:MAG: glycosyltransferase [Anaerolineae bacterium]
MTKSETTTPNDVVIYTADRWEHVCPTLRLLRPLQQADFRITAGVSWEGGALHTAVEPVQNADIAVIQRDFPNRIADYERVMEAARKAGKPVIYELDDLLFDLPDWHPDVAQYRRAYVDIIRAATEADAVTCTTEHLAERLRAFNEHVYVLPNYLDGTLWREALAQSIGAKSSRPVIIGYLGSRSHLPDLEMIKPALVQLLREFEHGIELRFWGTPPPADLLQWSNVVALDPGLVSYEAFATYFAREAGGEACDLFIAPIREHPFNVCKSSLKFLEYSALGKPGVYSDLTPYRDVVEHGENGFLAGSLTQWIDLLRELIKSAPLRHEIGRNARATVEEAWLLTDHASAWREVYEETADIVAGQRPSPVVHHVAKALSEAHKELVGELDARIRRYEDEINALEARERHLEQQRTLLEGEIAQRDNVIDTITNSPGWKLLARAGDARRRLIPPHSLREQIFYKGMQIAAGLTGMGEGAGRGSASGPGAHTMAQRPVQIVPGETCPTPTITLLVIRAPEGAPVCSTDVTLDDVNLWVTSQTCPGIEVAVWHQGAKEAYRTSNPRHAWPAASVAEMSGGLSGRYVCVASHDLLQQPETYLEANLLALETEGLAFTVNARGSHSAVVEGLEDHRLPGSQMNALLRQVVHRGCLGEGLTLDLASWTGTPAGKLIVHTSEVTETGQGLALDTPLPSGLQLTGNHLVTGAGDPSAPLLLHPVTSVMPKALLSDDRPTVLVAMPFIAVGGAEQVAFDMMRYLDDEIRFLVVTADPHNRALGTRSDAFRQLTPYVYTAPDYIHTALNLSFWRYLIERFDVATFYIANGCTALYDALAPLKADYPDLRFANQVYDQRYGWIERYDEELIDVLDASIGCNSKIRDAFVARGVAESEAFLIENGVDTERFDPELYPESRRRILRERTKLPNDTKIVTFMARLHPQKRPMDFVELARRCANDPGLTFLMVGGGPLAGTVDAEVLRIGLQNLIRRPFSDGREILAISDVFVLPSEYEGMPLTVLEAQSLGKPVVVTDVGNNREVLARTHGGMVIDRIGDVGALRQAVQEMLQNPPDPAEVRAAVKRHFGLPEVAQRYRDALLGS